MLRYVCFYEVDKKTGSRISGHDFIATFISSRIRKVQKDGGTEQRQASMMNVQ